MTMNFYILSFIIGLAIIFFIAFFQYKRKKISIRKGMIAVLVYAILYLPYCLIRINSAGFLPKAIYITVLFIITTGILWHSVLKNKNTTPKQLMKALLIGCGIGIFLVILLIIGVVFYVLITGK